MVKPILFNTEMVCAILAGRKTVTRRAIKPHNPVKAAGEQYRQGFGLWIDPTTDNADNDGHIKDYSISPCWSTFKWYVDKYAPYHIGDILYVRETWAKLSDWIDVDPDVGVFDGYIYKADWDNNAKKTERPKWTPSIHMPKEAARIFLRVTNVSVARLQDITEEQAKAEGAKAHHCLDALNAFRVIWDSTLKSEKELNNYGWFANPWVWVIEFERTEKPNGI